MHRLANLRLVDVSDDRIYPRHVVSAGNETRPGVTHAFEAMKSELLAAKTVARRTDGALAVFDFMEGRSIDPGSAPATILGAVRAFLSSLDVRTPKASHGPWREATGPEASIAYAREALAGLRTSYTAMIDAGLYDFDHPLEMSASALCEQRMRARTSGRKRGRRATLSAALIRFGRARYAPPRRTLVELVRDSAARAEAAGWSEGEILYLMILHDGGCRPADPIGFTEADWYDAERCGDGCRSTSKGHGDVRVKTVRWKPETTERMRRYVDGLRRESMGGGHSVKGILKLGDAGELRQLDSPLLRDAAGRPIDYDRIARRFRRDIAGHCVDPATGRPPASRPTLHWHRHLFVYDNLALIELLPDAGDRLREKEELVSYLFWSTGLDMLATYGREFAERREAHQMARFMRRREERAAAVRAGTAPPPATAVRQAAPSAVSRMFRDRRLDATAPAAS